MQKLRKTILCYGDSNTYGYNPSNGLRYPEDIRWTGRLKSLLGDACRIIEEGCNGRTTVFDDPMEGWKNGASYAPDFKGEVEKQIQNAQFFLQGILEYVDRVFSRKENGTSD